MCCIACGASAYDGRAPAACCGDEEKIEKRTQEYTEKFANPFIAASRGYIDDVIMPYNSRKKLIESFEMLKNKQQENPWRKHDNIPL